MDTLQELYLSDMEYKRRVGIVERTASRPAMPGQSRQNWVAPTYALAAFASALIIAIIAV
jgi:hypothetical protein